MIRYDVHVGMSQICCLLFDVTVLMDWAQRHCQQRNLRLSHFVPLLMLSLEFSAHSYAQFQQSGKACLQLLGETVYN